jgi:hypothetical protein
MKYIAILVKGANYWYGFDKEKVEEGGNQFVGKSGWGNGGASISIEISSDLIIGRIESDTLQYR